MNNFIETQADRLLRLQRETQNLQDYCSATATIAKPHLPKNMVDEFVIMKLEALLDGLENPERKIKHPLFAWPSFGTESVESYLGEMFYWVAALIERHGISLQPTGGESQSRDYYDVVFQDHDITGSEQIRQAIWSLKGDLRTQPVSNSANTNRLILFKTVVSALKRAGIDLNTDTIAIRCNPF